MFGSARKTFSQYSYGCAAMASQSRSSHAWASSAVANCGCFSNRGSSKVCSMPTARLSAWA